jgi:hypothetical protein
MRTGQRFNHPRERQGLVGRLTWGDGRDAFAGHDPSDEGHQAKTALLLGEPLPGSRLGGGLLGFVPVVGKRLVFQASSGGASFFT